MSSFFFWFIGSSHLLLWIAIAGAQAQQQQPRDVTDAGDKPNLVYYNTVSNLTEGSQQQKDMDTIFEFLIGATPPNGFATCVGYGSFFNPVYGHTACYSMPDKSRCSDCLRSSYNYGRQILKTVGFRSWTNSSDSRCNVRYDINNLTSSLPSDTLGILGPNASAPSPAPGTPVTPGVTLQTPPGSQNSGKSKTPAIVGAAVGASVCMVLLILAGIFVLKRRKRQRLRDVVRGPSDEILGATKGTIVFSYQELCSATGDFKEQNKLGQGGFGPVYKAQLGDGKLLAVKKLSVGSQQGKREFVNEINIITSIQHRNLVKLIGYCAEGDHRLLVYEFLENGSLDRALFENHHGTSLDWPSRVQIVIGVAKGIAYLHEESHVQIIHRDIKASNILLDRNLQPKISDFGISKLEDAMTTADTMSTRVAGTLGYMAPEYVTRGRLSTKADVFSFGVLVLEIISGRKCMDQTLPAEEEILLQKTWILYKADKLEELLDARLGRNYVPDDAYRMVHVAMLCAQEFEGSRPTMSEVVAMLMGFLEMPPLSTNEAPSFFNRLAQHVQQGWTSNSSNTGPSASDQSSSITSLHAR